MTDLPSCDKEIYEKGEHLYSITQTNSDEIEDWVKLIRKKSGQRVDWHWFGGVACIRVLGDIEKIVKTVDDNPPDTKHFKYVGDFNGGIPINIFK